MSITEGFYILSSIASAELEILNPPTQINYSLQETLHSGLSAIQQKCAAHTRRGRSLVVECKLTA